MNRVRGVALLVVGLALAAAAAATGPYLGAERDAGEGFRLRLRQIVDEGGALPRNRGGPSDTGFELYVAYAMAALFVIAVGYLLVRVGVFLVRLIQLRLAPSGGGGGAAEYDAGEESLDDAPTALRKRVADELAALSADLDADGDAREVVIACYARMERAFAAAGAARRPDESPMELLARVLDELNAPEADVRRLTALFSEARFSAHPVTAEMRAAARRSLASVADALAVPA